MHKFPQNLSHVLKHLVSVMAFSRPISDHTKILAQKLWKQTENQNMETNDQFCFYSFPYCNLRRSVVMLSSIIYG